MDRGDQTKTSHNKRENLKMEEFNPHELREASWEETIDVLTADMNPRDLDIILLAERYREYIQELQSHDFKVSAQAVRVCSALLNMKAERLAWEEQDQEEFEEEPMEDPMAFEEEEPEQIEENGEPDLEVGPDLDMPVKQKPVRRVHRNELKESLRDALEVKEKREERQERRQQMDQQFEMDEDDLETKLNNLMSNIKGLITSKTKEKIDFNNLVSDQDNQERIEKFKHVLHLENDEQVELIQEDFLGDLHVKPEENTAN